MLLLTWVEYLWQKTNFSLPLNYCFSLTLRKQLGDKPLINGFYFPKGKFPVLGCSVDNRAYVSLSVTRDSGFL